MATAPASAPPAPAEGPHLTVERHDGIAVLTLNRPDRLNAFTSDMGALLEQEVTAAGTDEAVRAIVITGAGRGFCAGADMGTLNRISGAGATAEPGDEAPPAAEGIEANFTQRFSHMMTCPKPVIAAINGPAAGLGFVIPLYADMRVAAASAFVSTAFAQRGLIAEWGSSWLLPRLVGTAHAMDMLFSSRKVPAHELLAMGYVSRVLPDEGFLAAVLAEARQLFEKTSPRSIRVMKRQVWRSLFQDFATSYDEAYREMTASFGSEDFKEGVAHFLEKRPPRFSGR